jgi:hypothetical protein
MRTKHLFGAVVLTCATVLGCGKKPEESVQPQPTPPALGEPNYSLPVEDLLKEFANDGKAALAKYRNTVVEVTGKTQTHAALGRAGHLPANSRVVGDRWVVSFQTGFRSLLSCSGRDLAIIGKIFQGQWVRIKGRLTTEEDGIFPQLKESEVLEIGPDPSVRITAAELAAAAEQDAAALDKRCAEKSLVLSGTVARTINPESEELVELKAGTKTQVFCHLGPSRHFYQTGFTAGEQIVLVGTLNTPTMPDSVNVSDCIPLNRIPK